MRLTNISGTINFIFQDIYKELHNRTRDWNRTSTFLRTHGPEPCASTNSATRANMVEIILIKINGLFNYVQEFTKTQKLMLVT